MANPAPTINQINAFNATQGTTIDFNIIGGTDLVRSNIIYIYDLDDNSLICTHLYVSTESIHELPANTDGSIVYESGKSSADFVNGAQYYAQIQTFTDIAGTEGGSGLSVAKMFWCLVDPTLTIDTIPSTISTTSYNVSATYNANTSVVSNIIQQYQFSLYSATGSLLQSSGVVVGSGTQQGTSTTYDISYNFSGLSVGSSYYVVVDVTTTQGMSVSAQSGTFTVSIDTPTLGEATVVNNACDGYISVTSNLSGEYGGSGSGEIVSFETDSENVFTKLQVDLEPVQDLHGYDKPWVGGAGVNKFDASATTNLRDFSRNGETFTNTNTDTRSSVVFNVVYLSNGSVISVSNSISITATGRHSLVINVPSNADALRIRDSGSNRDLYFEYPFSGSGYYTISADFTSVNPTVAGGLVITNIQLETGSTATSYAPYSNICPISGHDDVEVDVVGKNLFDGNWLIGYFDTSNNGAFVSSNTWRSYKWRVKPNTAYIVSGVGVNGFLIEWKTDGTILSRPASLVTSGFTTGADTIYCGFYTNKSYVDSSSNVQIEQSTTATAYEPYTETTVSQEFNVSLTPTSKDTDPYLFKAVGDIYGDRLEEDIVGATVNWNQLVDTHKATETVNGITFTNNNDGSWTINGTASARAQMTFMTIPIVSGHKYLVVSNFTTVNANWRVIFQGDWITSSSIVNCVNTNNAISFDVASGTTLSNVKSTPKLVDLTAYFGNATIADAIYAMEQAEAGSGVAFMRKYFPKLFSADYDTGTLKSVNPTAHVTRGVNIFDGETESGYINPTTGLEQTNASYVRAKNYNKCLPNTNYYAHVASDIVTLVACWYDANKNYIGFTSTASLANTVFQSPSNAYYFRFYTGASTWSVEKFCINISDPTINGKYFPYEEHTYDLGNVTLRGIPKLVNGKLTYDGDVRKYDGQTNREYGYIEFDGSSDENWSLSGNTANNQYIINVANAMRTNYATGQVLCNRLFEISGEYGYAHNDIDGVSLWETSTFGTGQIRVSLNVDIVNRNVTNFRTWLSNNPLQIIYPLETSTAETTVPFEQIQEVSKYGTLEYITTNDVPVGHNTTYLTRDVFGGYIDLVSGVLTVTSRGLLLDGSETWTWENNNLRAYIALHEMARLSDYMGAIFCDKIQTTQHQAQLPTTGITGYQQSSSYPNQNWLYVKISGVTTFDDFKNWIANNTPQVIYPLATPLTYQLTPKQIQTLVGVNNVWSEQGDIELSYHIPITNLLVKRQDVDDVSGNWLTLYSQPITQASDMDFTFIDFLNQYGKTYKYALVPLLTQTQSGVEVEVEGGYTVSDEVQSIFDGVFISDSTGSQKCKANVGYGNVNMNQSVGSITPIGSQYPIIVTNSNNRYHNGSISGMIVPDDYYYNGNLSRIDMVNKRNELEQFLTNKRAKIIKDWNGNIWLVMIMDNIDCSFDNNYGMGIVTFNANWLEVGDPTNQEDLQATGLIDVGGV